MYGPKQVMGGIAMLEKDVVPRPASALAGLVDDYLHHLKSKEVSHRTIEWHHWTLNRMLLPFCAQHHIETPSQLSTRLLERLQVELLERPNMHTGKPLSKASVRTYMRSVGHFLRWAKRTGEDVPQPPASVRVPKQARERLTREDLEKLEDKARTERDKLLIRVLADTGIRLGELVHLTLDDLIEKREGGQLRRYLRISHRQHGGGAKGDSSRFVPIASPRLWRRLQKYRDHTRPKDTGSHRLFLSHSRNSKTGLYMPLQERGVQLLIRGLAMDALGRRVHPHLLRHAFVAWALKETSTVVVARTLGHSSTAMVDRVYSEMTGSDDAYDALTRLSRAEEEDD